MHFRIMKWPLKIFTPAVLFASSGSLGAQPAFPVQNMQNAANYSDETGGSSTLILQNGSIAFEAYHNGADSSTATHIASATKGFWAMIAAHALEANIFESYDELVANTLTEWQNPALHPGKSQITIRHLLQLSSGLSQNVEQIQGLEPSAPDLYQYVVDSLNLVFLPGTNFQYGPSNYYAFGVLLERKLENLGIDLNPLQYLDSVIFQPIGLEYDNWQHDASGNPHIPNGCFVTPRNLIRFGQLLLQKGRWDGVQLVDSVLVEDLFVADGPNPGHAKFLWANNQGGYGVFPFQSAPAGAEGGFMYHDGYTEIIGALGAGKNRMYLIPSLNAVALRQTQLSGDNFSDHEFLSLLLADLPLSSTVEHPFRGIHVFPNPTLSTISFSTDHLPASYKVEVFHINGTSALRGQNQGMLDSSSLSSGTYILRIQTDDRVYHSKFVKL